jgi:O-antigen ligase
VLAFGTVFYLMFLSRNYAHSLVVLICVSLWNVPIVMFGNSLSAGVFLVDAALFAMLVRYFAFGVRPLLREYTFPVVSFFAFIVAYILLRSVVVFVYEDYGYYDKFIVYGVFRWVCFLLLLIVFYQKISVSDVKSIIGLVGNVLIVYFLLAIVHQQGVVDLSAIRATGHERIYEYSWLSSFVGRTFLGNGSAVTAFVCSAGVFIAIYNYYSGEKSFRTLLLGWLGFFALLGTQSRTDAIALIVTLGVVYALLAKGRSTLRLYVVSLMSATGLLFLVGLYIYVFNIDFLGTITYQRFFGTDYVGQYSGTSGGTLAYRMDGWAAAVDYLYENPLTAIIDFGPNGYRMLTTSGVGLLNYGHNVYLHTIVEIGFVGFVLLMYWGLKVHSYYSVVKLHPSESVRAFGVLFLLIMTQRLLAGFSVDTLFAVDNAITVNVFVLAILGMLLNLVSMKSGGGSVGRHKLVGTSGSRRDDLK